MVLRRRGPRVQWQPVCVGVDGPTHARRGDTFGRRPVARRLGALGRGRDPRLGTGFPWAQRRPRLRARAIVGSASRAHRIAVPAAHRADLVDEPGASERSASTSALAGPSWVWLALVFVLMGSAVHGHRSALALWAVPSSGIRAAMVAWAPLRRHRVATVRSGPRRLLGDLRLDRLLIAQRRPGGRSRARRGGGEERIAVALMRRSIRTSTGRSILEPRVGVAHRYFFWASSRDR